MTISLMANVPHQLIIGSIKYIMKCNGQFNNSQRGTKMPSINGNNINDINPVDRVQTLIESALPAVFADLRVINLFQ